MNISKHEQRVLHELALGGEIKFMRADNGKNQISAVFYTRRLRFHGLHLGRIHAAQGKTFYQIHQGRPVPHHETGQHIRACPNEPDLRKPNET